MTPTNEKSREDGHLADTIATHYGLNFEHAALLSKDIARALAAAREDERRKIADWIKRSSEMVIRSPDEAVAYLAVLPELIRSNAISAQEHNVAPSE